MPQTPGDAKDRTIYGKYRSAWKDSVDYSQRVFGAKMNIFVCSPLRGDTKENLKNAQEYCRKIILNYDTPYAPHLYFTSFLNDNAPTERSMGMAAGQRWMERCEEMWVYGDIVSEGMKEEITYWTIYIKKPIRFQ